MTGYILVANTPNRVATVHLSDCSHLGSSPLQETASAHRTAFEDGLEAIFAAQSAMPTNFGLCRHCLRRFNRLRFASVD